MLVQYDKHSIAQTNVHKWMDRFKWGMTTPDDKGQSGQPLTSQTDDHCAKVDALIKEKDGLLQVKLH